MNAVTNGFALLKALLLALIGTVMPLSVASKTLLIHELSLRNVRSDRFPLGCIAEIADTTLKRVRVSYVIASRTHLRHIPLRNMLVYSTEDVADRIAEILGVKAIGPSDDTLRQKDRAELEAVLNRHGFNPPP